MVVERGLFTVTYNKKYVQSVSWTTPGPTWAVQEALRIEWDAHARNNPGETMPQATKEAIAKMDARLHK